MAPWASAAVVTVFVTAVAVLMGFSGLDARVRTHLLAGLFMTVAFAALAYAMRAVTRGGAFAGAVVAFALYAGAGPGAFAALVTVFLLAMISTRIGYARKQALGKAESQRGRSAAQVLANLGAAAVLAVVAVVLPNIAGYFRFIWYHNVLLIAVAAALAEAAGDTVSSECGEAWSSRVHLITTWESVAPGTDGGISAPGTLAGAVAAVIVACVCAFLRMITVSDLPIVAGAAIMGVFFDSILGAALQRRRLIGNNAVNVAGTTFAALVAIAIAFL